MRIKLFFPPPITSGLFVYLTFMPQGLGILASFLRKNGISVDLQDLDAELRGHSFYFRQKKIINQLFKYSRAQLQAGHYTGISETRNDLLAEDLLCLANVEGHDLVGISVHSGAQILSSLLLAEKIKKEHNIPIVIGGPYVTAFAHLFFEKYRFIDYAIVGQGEVPLLKLTEHLQGKASIDKVPSLWHRDKAKTVFNGRTFYDIEDQSCPDFDGFSLDLYRYHVVAGEKVLFMHYSTSKGCPEKCMFCMPSQKIDGPWQCKTAKKIVDDLAFLKQKYKSSIFTFRDANFNVSTQHVNQLCDELIRRKVDIQWHAMAEAKNLNQDLLFKMGKAGCRSLLWGLESGSNNTLKMMKKGINAEESVKLLKMAKRAGISNAVSLMIGYPYETSQDLELTAALIKNNASLIDDLQPFVFKLMHGSCLYVNRKALKIMIEEDQAFSLFFVYRHKTIAGCVTRDQNRALIKSRNKVIAYSLYYIRYKRLRFPFNVIIKSLGPVLARVFFTLLKRAQVDRFQFRYKNAHIDSVFKQRGSNAD